MYDLFIYFFLEETSDQFPIHKNDKVQTIQNAQDCTLKKHQVKNILVTSLQLSVHLGQTSKTLVQNAPTVLKNPEEYLEYQQQQN